MGKVFNITADCKPELHYMVNIDSRLKKIKELIDKGEYFAINRARQYGKTTTLRGLSRFLQKEYLVADMDFQTFGDAKFKNENVFSLAFARVFIRVLKRKENTFSERMQEIIREMEEILRRKDENFELQELFEYVSDICGAATAPVVLIIDEVDSATNNQVFLDFLSQLRAYYIDRDQTPAFRSVILAGVYDIKNLKMKIRPGDSHRRNSPWNIAVKFDVDMSFSKEDIAGMLREYEADWNTGMDIQETAGGLYAYTSGYPVLVSALCKILDEELPASGRYPDKKSAWTQKGLLEAVRILLSEKNTLFESMINKLSDYPQLKSMVKTMLFTGQSILYNPDNEGIDMAVMFGFASVADNTVRIANRIFETRLYNLFLSELGEGGADLYKESLKDKEGFVENGILNMKRVLEKFTVHFHDIYGDCDGDFLEEDGRKYFLLYLRPIINGTGNYYIEARTRNLRRTDVIVDYNGVQYIIEMKIWHGEEYHRRGEEQLAGYLETGNPVSEDHAAVLQSLAMLCTAAGQIPQAQNCLTKAMQIYKTLYSSDPEMLDQKQQTLMQLLREAQEKKKSLHFGSISHP